MGVSGVSGGREGSRGVARPVPGGSVSCPRGGRENDFLKKRAHVGARCEHVAQPLENKKNCHIETFIIAEKSIIIFTLLHA